MIEKPVIIRSRIPLRLGFFGGGTDVDPYATEHGGAVLSATINKYAYSTWLIDESSKKFEVTSRDLGIFEIIKSDEDIDYSGDLELVKATLGLMEIDKGGKFYLESDAPIGSGLGTSSAVCAGLVAAIWEGSNKYNHLPATRHNFWRDVADLAYKIERVELGNPGGYQDQYGCAKGGFNIISNYKDSDEIKVKPLKIDGEIKRELEYSILMCNTGKARLSHNVIGKQKEEYEKGQNLEVLHSLKGLVDKGVEALVEGDIPKFGKLIGESWGFKRGVATGTSTTELDRLYDAAMKTSYVYGGKVSGAGGGGFMYFICNPHHKQEVKKAIEKENIEMSQGPNTLNLTFSTVKFEDKGVYVWRP